jgi:hypothetical protein
LEYHLLNFICYDGLPPPPKLLATIEFLTLVPFEADPLDGEVDWNAAGIVTLVKLVKLGTDITLFAKLDPLGLTGLTAKLDALTLTIEDAGGKRDLGLFGFTRGNSPKFLIVIGLYGSTSVLTGVARSDAIVALRVLIKANKRLFSLVKLTFSEVRFCN